MKLVFACLGNICRSPMLEGWMHHAIAQRHDLDWLQVDSCGMSAEHAGQPPDARAIRIAAEHGVDISRQRARQITHEDFSDADLILFADSATLAAGRRKGGAHPHAHMTRVMEWVDLKPFDLDDPWYGDMRDFKVCWARIEVAGPRLVERLQRLRDA